jgi:putative RecB family exonuclease
MTPATVPVAPEARNASTAPEAPQASPLPAGTSSDHPGAPETAEQAPALANSLSPSRAADFLACPLLYRFRVIDRLPEPPSPAAARGTLVHAVLERLYDAPPASRTPATARALLEPQWERLLAEIPDYQTLFADKAEREAWLAEAAAMLDRYFTLEDPARLAPTHRELAVECVTGSGLRLHGYIDRIDIASSGEIRIVDYKTGAAPMEEYVARAMFQMRFYALVLWRAQGRLPKLLQLIYLGNGEIVRYAPDEADLLATERKIEALWRAIERARSAGDWRPRPSRLCEWCAHQAICPAFGGTPPPLPQPGPEPQTRPVAVPGGDGQHAGGPVPGAPQTTAPRPAVPSAGPSGAGHQPAQPPEPEAQPTAHGVSTTR